MCGNSLKRSIESCAQNVELLENIRAIYHRIDDAVREQQAICFGGGACCRFDCAGHRLYVSIGELALLTQNAPPKPERCAMRRCPYQVGPRCTARENRPLGCRLYFCDPSLESWSRRMYEEHHRELRILHTACGEQYEYRELTASIEELCCK